MLFKIAIKNLFGAKLRTGLNVFVTSISFFLVIFVSGMYDGMREYAKNNFEWDYWGLSYKENFEYLLKHEKKEKFYIWNSSKTKIFYSLFSLNYEDRSKFVVVKNKNNANYWITNYYLDKHNYDPDFYQKYKIINEVKVDEVSINSLFKKKE